MEGCLADVRADPEGQNVGAGHRSRKCSRNSNGHRLCRIASLITLTGTGWCEQGAPNTVADDERNR